MKTKRIVSLLLGLVMILALLPAAALAAEADEVIEITTVAQLKELAAQVNAGNDQKGKYYLLKNDLDLGGSESNQWTPIGYYVSGLSNKDKCVGFAGTFDGGGHTIRGLYIDADTAGVDASNTKGLFGYVVQKGTVKNLTVDGFIRGDRYVGLVVAYNSNGTVENCHSMGVVRDCFSKVGGVVGCNTGTVKNCSNSAPVSAGKLNPAGRLVGDEVGGVVGDSSGMLANISNCYNTGAVIGISEVGGVVGNNGRTLVNCYNTGDVTGDEYVGGVVGMVMNETQMCYNTGKVSGNVDVGGVAGLKLSEKLEYSYNLSGTAAKTVGEDRNSWGSATSTVLSDAAFAQQSSFVGWDFSTVWVMQGGRPTLRENPEGSHGSSASTTPTTPAGPAVTMTKQNLTVNGVAQNAEIYNIDGSNYFKLRSIAALLNGTGSQFDVLFDMERNVIVVRTDDFYIKGTDDLVVGADKSSTARPSTQSIEIDGKKVDLAGYNIGGNNFFKLRDLGAALNFDVDYDSATSTMIIKSK